MEGHIGGHIGEDQEERGGVGDDAIEGRRDEKDSTERGRA